MTPSRKDLRLLALALRVAGRSSPLLGYRLGCVIASKGEVISVGCNSTKTHPIAAQLGYRFSALHAELSAVLGIDEKDLQGCTAYVGRANRQGMTLLAKPCPICMNVLVTCGIRNVWYTNKLGPEYMDLRIPRVGTVL